MEVREIETIIESIAGDSSSGASELVRESHRCIEKLVSALEKGHLGEENVLAWLEKLALARREMVPIGNLVSIFTEEAGDFSGDGVERGLARIRVAISEEEEIPEKISRDIEPLFHGDASRILVYSYSSTVCRVLANLCGKARITVMTSEGRPTGDGARLLEKLGDVEIAFEMHTDAGLMSGAGGADIAFFGTDGWSDNYFVNKTGTKALVQILDIHGKNAFVFASPLKKADDETLLALSFPHHDFAEWLPHPPERVTVKNPHFEVIPRYPNVTLFGGK
ncbi:MAG: hypothetical protein GTN70_12025 [Deltaproteobacteria bacterium]|nr:hypothetical protein [Deltaproteobacteria bacterium]NIS78498.1 hypothetical protein [Deltaproteobacteria bacterium]